MIKQKHVFFRVLSLTLCLALSFCLIACSQSSGDQSGTGASNADEILASVSDLDLEFSDRDLRADYSESGAVRIEFSNSSVKIEGTGAAADGTNVKISKEGTYILSGSCKNGTLTVDASKEAKIQLVLDGLSLSCESGPSLFVRSADKVFLTLADGSENTLSDGNDYSIVDDGTTLDAAVFSCEDLTVNGTGKLTVNGNYKHGIVSKDDLVIVGAALEVKSSGAGLCGKDCVKISDGTVSVNSGSDAIRSDNEEDENCGFVYIKDGAFELSAQNDGIQAQSVIKIDGGTFKITTKSASSSESAKGIKAEKSVIISNGTFDITSADDAIHSNGDIAITGGKFTVSSGDDGIHATDDLAISGGEIDILKSYEGIEATNINISGGKLSVVASDDGMNAAGGNDGNQTAGAFSMGGRHGQDMFSSSTGTLTISGGYIFVNASGDGLDSNGTLTVSGGIILVDGPSNSGNGALDYQTSAEISGGVLIALGASGMAENVTSVSNQGSFLVTFSAQGAGTSFSVCDEDGNVLVSLKSTKAYNSAVVSAPSVQKGNDYYIYVGATVDGADENGYAEGSTQSGGTLLGSLTMTSDILGGGSGMGGGPGGMGGNHGGFPR